MKSAPQPPSRRTPRRRGLGRTIISTVAAASLAFTLGAFPAPEAAAATATITVNGNDIQANNVNGLTFKGFGVLSANSTSAVLMDYKAQHPEAYAQLLQVLFGGEHPIMDHVKIELGNDRNTSTGPNPGTMRYETELANPARDPGFQLAADAKRINPDLKVSILRWREPAWANNNDKIYDWQKNTILAAYRTYGYMVDYVNPGRNETAVNTTWTITYADRMANDSVGYVSSDPEHAGWVDGQEQALYQKIQIIVDDSSGVSGFGGTLRSNASFRNVVDVVGYHYSTNDDSSGNFKWFADTHDGEVWNSEAQATFSNSAFRPNNNATNDNNNTYPNPGTGIGGLNSALEMGNTIIKGYVNSRRTHFIYQPAIGAFYEGGQYSHKELVSARDPWSGWIHYDAGLAVLQHFSDFAVLGWENDTNTAGIWRGVTPASVATATGTNPVVGRNGGANYMTLAAPDKSDFSTVIINDYGATSYYTINVSNMNLGADETLEVWETRAADPGQVFNANYKKHVADLTPVGGSYTLELKPYSMVTVTSLDLDSDPAVTKPLPVEGERTVLDIEQNGNGVLWADDFEYGDKTVPVFDAQGNPTATTQSFIDSRGGPTGADPLYTWDRNGAFEAYLDGDNYVLRQQLDESAYGLGSAWNGGDPITGIGDFRWVNYKASVDVRFDLTAVSNNSNYAAIGVRSTGGDNSQNLSSTPYVLRLSRSGAWALQNFGSTRASGTVTVDGGAWYNLALEAAGNVVTAYIDGVPVGSYTDPTPVLSGRVDLASSFDFTSFDNLKVEKLPAYVPYYAERLDGMEMNDLASPPNVKLVYGGTWSHTNGEGMYNYQRSISRTSTPGASVSYTFTGTGLDILGNNGGAGQLSLTVDGVRLSSSEKSWARSAFWRTSYSLRGLPLGQHTVTLTLLSGTLVVDSFDTVSGPVKNPAAIDVSVIEDALAETANVVRTPDFSEADWASFSTTRAHALAAVADPAAYGLDAEGPAQIAARLLGTTLPGSWAFTPNTVWQATWVGQAPELPATLTATNSDTDTTAEFPVTWDTSGASFNTAWQTVQIPGRYATLDVTAFVEVVPEGLVYFVDGNGVASGLGAGGSALGYDSPAWAAIKALVEGDGGTLLNDRPDQAYTGTATWGHRAYNSSGGSATVEYKGIVTGPYSKASTTGYSTSNSTGANIRYTFTLPAGDYALAFHSYSWWASTSRSTQAFIDYGSTTSSQALASFTLNTTTPAYSGQYNVSLAEPGTVTLRLRASNSQSPLFSWAAVYEVVPTAIAVVPGTATVAPGASETFTANVTMSNGTVRNTAEWTVAGAVSLDTGVENGVLTVGFDEPEGTLTVTAVSADDATKVATAVVTVQKDASALAAAIASAEELDEALYTVSSWAGLPAVLDTAKAVLANANASQAEINAAAEALAAQVAGLEERGSVAALAEFVAGLPDLDLALYTTATAAAFEEALAAAEAAVADASDMTQDDVDDIYGALVAAYGSLEVKAVELDIVTRPDKRVYTVGENLDLTGLAVRVLYADGTDAELDGADYEVTGYDALTVGEQTLTVAATIGGEALEATFEVTVAQNRLDLAVSVTTRCLVGKAYLTVQVVNASAVPAELMIESEFGFKAVASVAAGKTASHAYTTRLPAYGAGAVTVTGTGLVAGPGAPVADFTVNYPAASCG